MSLELRRSLLLLSSNFNTHTAYHSPEIYFSCLSFSRVLIQGKLSTLTELSSAARERLVIQQSSSCGFLMFGFLLFFCLHFQFFHLLTGGKLTSVFRSKKITPNQKFTLQISPRIAIAQSIYVH